MNFEAKLNALRNEALEAAGPHRLAIDEALERIDVEVAALRAAGMTVDIDWPYGRGDVAKASAAKVRVSLGMTL